MADTAKLKNSQIPALVVKAEEIKRLFSDKKYLEVIKCIDKINKFLDAEFLDYSFFDSKMICFIYLGISYLELGFYKDAYNVFKKVEERYEYLKQSKHFWKTVKANPRDREERELANIALDFLNKQISTFNKHNSGRYLSNLAYTCYKLGKYEEAIKYYKKALIRRPKDIQLNLGIAQSQYKMYKIILPLKIKKSFKKTISLLYSEQTSFDSLLALGKMYYFCKEYDNALSFVQKSLELADDEPVKKVYAYDWLSRIAYKTKHHEVAITYYEEIIKCIVDSPDNQTDVIHPKPKLLDMMKYLNENKKIVKRKELRNLWCTVLVNIAITILFGFLNNWELFKKFFNN